MNGFMKKSLVALSLGFASVAAFATDPVTLPSTGIDIGGYITAGITQLGTTVAIAVGGYVVSVE